MKLPLIKQVTFVTSISVVFRKIRSHNQT